MAVTTSSDGAIALPEPIRVRRRSGRKLLVAGPGRRRAALGRRENVAPAGAGLRLRWLRQLDTGEFASMSDIARREGADPSYVARMLKLTLLAPDIIEAILNDTLPDHIRLHELSINPPTLWDEQRRKSGARLSADIFAAAPQVCNDDRHTRWANIAP